jgi:hypothetical protein
MAWYGERTKQRIRGRVTEIVRAKCALLKSEHQKDLAIRYPPPSRPMVEVYTPATRPGILRALMKLDRSQANWPATGFGKCLLVKAGEYEEPPDGERRHAAGEWVLRTAWAVQMQQTRE